MKAKVAVYIAAVTIAFSSSPAIAAMIGDSSAFFVNPAGLAVTADTSRKFSCGNIPIFSQNVTALSATIPDFTVSGSLTCNALSLGAGQKANSCRWVPETYLGMLWDRGAEMISHNIPQREGFQAFEHARFMLLQYRTCQQYNRDGTVDIPIAIEMLYGYVVAKTFGRNSALWEPRVEIATEAESDIANIRAQAVSVLVTRPFQLSLELSPNALHMYKKRRDVMPASSDRMWDSASRLSSLSRHAPESAARLIPGADSGYAGADGVPSLYSSAAVRSEADPTSSSECNINSPAGTWMYQPNAFSPSPTLRAKCCASACSALLVTIGVTPTSVTMATCCSACNKANCAAASSQSSAAVSLMSEIAVPSMLNAYVTSVSVTL